MVLLYVIPVKAKKTLKILAICLVLAMAVAMAVSAATSSVTLTKSMYYVSGSSSAFSSAQAKYRGTIYPDSTANCQIYLFGKTANGNTGVSSRILNLGSGTCSWTGPFTASRYGVTAWYPYAQPYGSSSTGGHCTASVSSY